MAGNYRSGRARKTTEQHILAGSFRGDRHGPRPREDELVSIPHRPDGLDEEAMWLWDLVVSDLATKGIARKLDTAMLWSMCEMWSLYRRAHVLAVANPVDKETRCAVLAYRDAFERAAVRCGLPPADRARLTASGIEAEKRQPVPKRNRAI